MGNSGRCVLAAKQSPHRPGISRTAGLRARSDGLFIVPRTKHLSWRKEIFMFDAMLGRGSFTKRPSRAPRKRLEVEWLEDRTLPSTVALVKDINSTGTFGSDPDALADINGTLYFVADDGVHGRELWKTDGTEKGTVLVKDIWPGPR